MSWWVIHSERILELLRRAADGEDPDALLLEEYANSDSEQIE